MRTDMAQLLVETPRRHAGEFFKTHRRKANHDPESAPTKQGMRKPYVERKEFGEYFAPLKGFLRKNVGRPWDKVFSELSQSLHGGGTVIDHTKMHLLRDFVILKPHWVNGKAHTPPPWYHDGPREIRKGAFYVDQQGILRTGKRVDPRYRRPKPGHGIIRINEQSGFIKIEGFWYRVWLRPIPLATKAQVLYDIVLKKRIHCRVQQRFRWQKIVAETVEPEVYEWRLEGSHGLYELKDFYGAEQYAYRKEQISSRTIRREGLDKKAA